MSGSSSGSVVVVEISNDWLKIAQAVPQRGGVALAKLHLQRFETLDGSLAGAVSAAFDRLGIPRSGVVACLPRQVVNVRMLELPSTDPSEIADMVELQAGKQTPYSRDEIVSDYRIVGSRREGYSRIVLAIVQRSALRQRFSILEEAGLDVDTMSVSSEGLLNWLRAVAPAEGTRAVLDVDSYFSDLSVVSGGQLLFTRGILVGANQLVDDADRWSGKLVDEIRRSLDAFRGEAPGSPLSGLIVTGAAAAVDGLGARLGEALGMEVGTMDSLRVAARRPAEPALGEGDFRRVSLTALIGMALAPGRLQLNLVPDSVRMRKGLALKARSLATLGILLMSALVAASLLANVRIFMLRERLAGIRREYARTAPAAAEVESMRQMVDLIRERQDKRLAAVAVLNAIHAGVPENVLLDQVSLERGGPEADSAGTAVVEGTAAQRRDISRLIKNLESAAEFRDVREGGSTAADSRTQRYRFRIVCAMENEP
ncbi:MAG: hypothetical protein FJ225_03890 [Lentisphaerae bacterium]|nr:hypothetical protein [Lentisphaerota bacterium]